MQPTVYSLPLRVVGAAVVRLRSRPTHEHTGYLLSVLCWRSARAAHKQSPPKTPGCQRRAQHFGVAHRDNAGLSAWPTRKKKTGERGAGELVSSHFNESLNETSKSPLSVYVSIELGWVKKKKKEGAQSSVRKKPRSAICNHPTSCPPTQKNSSKLEKKKLACVLFFFFPFRAKRTRTVLSHVPSPAPVPFSHISALQIVSVLPLQRAQM